MDYAVYFALVMVALFVNVNGFLRGAKKNEIDVVLSLLMVGLIIVAFLRDWKVGLIAIAVLVLSAIITRPFVARTASRFFRDQ